MTQDGTEYPLIVSFFNNPNEMSDEFSKYNEVRFYTIQPDGEYKLFMFHNSIDELDISALIMELSDGFTVNSADCTITDNTLGVKYKFDFANECITAEKN